MSRYEKWRELYFPAFWYAMGKSDDIVRASDFGNWYALKAMDTHNKEIPAHWQEWTKAIV